MSEADVVVIGGGPGGAALATLVAKAGHQVRLFERQEFPRFKVGESLIPAVNLTLERIGILDELNQSAYTEKFGVQFYSPSGPTRPFYFSEVEDPRMHKTWQVLRSDFDDRMLKNATKAGVLAETGVEVASILTQDDHADAVTGVEVRKQDGSCESVHAKVVVDATGQNGLLAKAFGQRQHIPGLENAAVFSHYEGVVRDEGVDAGSTLIFRLEGQAWIWFIPLPDTVSIGLVAPSHCLSDFGSSPAEILDTAIARCPALHERLQSAKRTMDVKAARDVSYRAARDGGSGWLLVGDALGFIDPIYSTGLLLAFNSAELGAKAIMDRLGKGASLDFGGYSKDFQTAFDQLLILVRAFYREDFHFGKLSQTPTYRQGLVDLLTGIVGTPEATEVTDTIQAVFDGERVL
jgi:flavin-dependent dehydrogenase